MRCIVYIRRCITEANSRATIPDGVVSRVSCVREHPRVRSRNIRYMQLRAYAWKCCLRAHMLSKTTSHITRTTHAKHRRAHRVVVIIRLLGGQPTKTNANTRATRRHEEKAYSKMSHIRLLIRSSGLCGGLCNALAGMNATRHTRQSPVVVVPLCRRRRRLVYGDFALGGQQQQRQHQQK